MRWKPSKLLMLISVFAVSMLVIAACGSDNDDKTTEATGAVASDVIAKEGDAMPEEGEVMAKEGDAMPKEGEVMAKEGDAMPKEGDAMAKEGDAMDTGHDAIMAMLPDKIIAPHFVDSVPNHGDALPQAPNTIVLNFDFNLHADSSLTVTRDGQPVSLGQKAISANELSISVPVTGGTGNGIYAVSYTACWPDRSCHEGSVSFIVDSAKTAAFTDMRGKAEVGVPMQNIAFAPSHIIVSPGTKVTWTNNDGVAHFVNSDPHPSHNGVPTLNSSTLNKDQTYSYTFATPGIFGFHCSAHTNMTGQVLVQA